MNTQGVDAAQLQGFCRDLSTTLALRASWSGRSRDQVLASLGEVLLQLLDPHLVFARLQSTTKGAPQDYVTINPRYREGLVLPNLAEVLEPWLRHDGGSAPGSQQLRLSGHESMPIIALGFGSKIISGTVVVAAARPTFPTQCEEILARATLSQVSLLLLEDLSDSQDNLVRSSATLPEQHRLSISPSPSDPATREPLELAAVVRSCADLVGLATLSGKALYVNPAGRRLIGLREEDPLPREISAYVTDGHRERLLHQILPMVARDGFWEGEIFLRHFQTDAAIPVLQHIFYVLDPSSGRRLALATICRDVTARKRAELTLSKAQQELAHASRVLSMGELTASLAHEINQPLAAIVANANAARRWLERRPPDQTRARESLDNIVRDGNRASAILQRVRAFSAKVAPYRELLNVNDVIREVVSIASHEISREQVLLTTQLDDALPAVLADRIELQQVVLNLVINSIEALRPVAGRPKDLRIVSTRPTRSTVEVCVRDNGNGIDLQDLERMFEAFFTTKSGGLGLGLAISRRLIEDHNGSLWAYANPGWGLTLAFTLPVPRQRVS